MKKTTNNTKTAATAAVDRLAETRESVGLPDTSTSQDCGRMFSGPRGVSIHRRSAHPELFHTENLPKLRMKPRWTEEDEHYFAHVEAELRLGGVVPRLINGNLRASFPE